MLGIISDSDWIIVFSCVSESGYPMHIISSVNTIYSLSASSRLCDTIFIASYAILFNISVSYSIPVISKYCLAFFNNLPEGWRVSPIFKMLYPLPDIWAMISVDILVFTDATISSINTIRTSSLSDSRYPWDIVSHITCTVAISVSLSCIKSLSCWLRVYGVVTLSIDGSVLFISVMMRKLVNLLIWEF